MKVTLGKYTGYLLGTQYQSNNMKAITLEGSDGGQGQTIGNVTVNLDIPLGHNQIILNQSDKFGEDCNLFNELRAQGIIDELIDTTRSGFNLYKIVTLTEKGMSLFLKK